MAVVFEEDGDDLGVGAGAEGDVFILGEALGYEGSHPVEFAKRGHGSELAVAEHVFELGLFGESKVGGVEGVDHAFGVDSVIGGKYGHCEPALQFHNDDFGHLFAGHVGHGGHFLGGECRGVASGSVFDVVSIKVLLEFSGDHDLGVGFWVRRVGEIFLSAYTLAQFPRQSNEVGKKEGGMGTGVDWCLILFPSGISFSFRACWATPLGVSETRVIDASDPASQNKIVKEAADLLAAGEVVALPTETVYGLGADALNPKAVARVFAAKERPEFDPLIVHVGSYEQVDEVADVPEELKEVVGRLMKAFWPGALTMVLPKKDCVPDIVTSGLSTVAVRMSAHPIMKAVVRKLERPIAAPSANRFGRISPTSASAVEKELGGRIPVIIDGGACREGLESTIVRPEAGEKKPVLHLLRSGPVTKEVLQRFGKVVKPKRNRSEEMPEAPGQLASHYAPVTPLRLLAKAEDFKPEPGKRYGLLSYCGSEKAGFINACEWDEVEELSPGNGKLAEAAVRFFFVLRKLDESGVDEIIAEPVSETGLGVAIMDKLRRASAR